MSEIHPAAINYIQTQQRAIAMYSRLRAATKNGTISWEGGHGSYDIKELETSAKRLTATSCGEGILSLLALVEGDRKSLIVTALEPNVHKAGLLRLYYSKGAIPEVSLSEDWGVTERGVVVPTKGFWSETDPHSSSDTMVIEWGDVDTYAPSARNEYLTRPSSTYLLSHAAVVSINLTYIDKVLQPLGV